MQTPAVSTKYPHILNVRFLAAFAIGILLGFGLHSITPISSMSAHPLYAVLALIASILILAGFIVFDVTRLHPVSLKRRLLIALAPLAAIIGFPIIFPLLISWLSSLLKLGALPGWLIFLYIVFFPIAVGFCVTFSLNGQDQRKWPFAAMIAWLGVVCTTLLLFYKATSGELMYTGPLELFAIALIVPGSLCVALGGWLGHKLRARLIVASS